MNYLQRFMGALFPDQKRLGEIQSVYDNLTLLGQLLGAGTDITGMRHDFQQLANVLLEQLAKEHYKKATLNLSSCARVAIDVLIRNLFERTADIGFLATDREICAFAEACEADPQVREDPAWQIRIYRHFAEYVAKYSVYHNIILLSPSGEVLAQLDTNNPVTRSGDCLVGDALTTDAPYVEVFRPLDLLPGDPSPLVYAYRVMSADGSHPVGVLCLCFRFQDECTRIFESLVAEDDWNVLTLLDANNCVIASSDNYQFPIGAKLETSADGACEIVRFAGREYLATTRHPKPYQGYDGPGWVGHAMAPLNHAFEVADAPELAAVPDTLLQDVLDLATLFSRELREIPVKAATIQQALNRAVWNGNIWLAREGDTRNAEFAKVLLREIGSTGMRTRDVFSESANNLYKTVLSSVLFDCAVQAALAIDIMDRNLYERANDCRWWALTREFREALAQGSQTGDAGRKRLTDILRHINSLYTVYSNLILFDAQGKVIAVSNAAADELIGKPFNGECVRQTLALKDPQAYHVSPFADSEYYGNAPTYLFTAAVPHPETNAAIGGIAVVFDSTDQFQSMLEDVLPRDQSGTVVDGAFAIFASIDGQVISSTDATVVIGSRLEMAREYLQLHHGESKNGLVVCSDRYYAVGSCMSAGYREFRGEGQTMLREVVALVFTPLSDQIRDPAMPRYNNQGTRIARAATRGIETIDIASFHIGNHWYGLHPASVVAAVDAVRLSPVPGSFNYVAGCLMYDDAATTVFDLSPFLNTPRVEQERRKPRANSGERQILILESAQQKVRFGILVDCLSEIAEIPVASIEALPEMMTDGRSIVDSLVKPQPEDNERRILVILSPERILQRINKA